MSKAKNKRLVVQDLAINVTNYGGADYICLTDMVRDVGGSALIESWIRKKDTIEYLGVWEVLNNPDFNSVEFDGIKNKAGSNRFVMSAKQWVEATNAKGLNARAGRYGGTYAHVDIALDFATWVSPELRFVVFKEFERFKAQETLNAKWDYHRFLTKVNYRLQTNAVKDILIPASMLPEVKMRYLYATEADLVNVAIFGITAQEWRTQNPLLVKKGDNIRDHATIEQLTVLANLESMNSMLISNNMPKSDRLEFLRKEAHRQLTVLLHFVHQLETIQAVN